MIEVKLMNINIADKFIGKQKSLLYVFGVATIIPLMNKVVFLIFWCVMYFLERGISGEGGAQSPPSWGGAILCGFKHFENISSIVWWVLIPIYLVLIWRKRCITRNKKVFWSVIVLLAGIIFMPVYFLIHILRYGSKEAPVDMSRPPLHRVGAAKKTKTIVVNTALVFFWCITISLVIGIGTIILFNKMMHSGDELEAAVRNFYDKYDRVPTNVVELGMHAASNNFQFDAHAYDAITYTSSNNYIYVEYQRGATSGKRYLKMNDNDDFTTVDNHASLPGLVAHFYKEQGFFPQSIEDIQKHIQSKNLAFDLTPYKNIRAKRKLFGRVIIQYSMKPQGPHSSSGSMEMAISVLDDYEIKINTE